MRIRNVTFDAQDAGALAAFWSAVLERPVAEGANVHFATIAPSAPAEPRLLFLRVPEERTAKNRVHVDLECDDLGVARTQLEGLGASFVHEKEEFGAHWMTFEDPEGNAFCAAAAEPF